MLPDLDLTRCLRTPSLSPPLPLSLFAAQTMPSPKRLSSSAKKRAANKADEGDATYDDDRGASGLARDFKKGLEGQVAKKLGVKKPQATEIKSFLDEEFDDFSTIDREEFLLKTKKWKTFEKLGIGKPELKRIYHSIDRKAGGE